MYLGIGTRLNGMEYKGMIISNVGIGDTLDDVLEYYNSLGIEEEDIYNSKTKKIETRQIEVYFTTYEDNELYVSKIVYKDGNNDLVTLEDADSIIIPTIGVEIRMNDLKQTINSINKMLDSIGEESLTKSENKYTASDMETGAEFILEITGNEKENKIEQIVLR